MNERIEELAQGCFEYFEGTLDGDIVEFNYKKFAELIVKECMEVILAQNKSFNVIDEWDRGYVLGLESSKDAIKEHFGEQNENRN